MGFAPALVDLSLVLALFSCQLLVLLVLLALLALLMTESIEKQKRDRQSTAASSEHRDEPMDVDVPASSPSSLPFPGTVINGAHAVVHHDIKNLSKAGLRELCDGFRLAKTGNKATLTDRLKKFSVDRWEWDRCMSLSQPSSSSSSPARSERRLPARRLTDPHSLLTGARNRHRGPRNAGVTKGGVAKPPKKKGTMKQSAL
ncbi:hypothetical protein EDB86DRAFT_3078510 [Lactarius hatsudake]|nr:hypothetical protein EDB86DRAFT_3078510 [Lactarius hatsudake]